MKRTLTKTDKVAVPVIIALSVLVPIIVLILMYLPERYNIFGTQTGEIDQRSSKFDLPRGQMPKSRGMFF